MQILDQIPEVLRLLRSAFHLLEVLFRRLASVVKRLRDQLQSCLYGLLDVRLDLVDIRKDGLQNSSEICFEDMQDEGQNRAIDGVDWLLQSVGENHVQPAEAPTVDKIVPPLIVKGAFRFLEDDHIVVVIHIARILAQQKLYNLQRVKEPVRLVLGKDLVPVLMLFQISYLLTNLLAHWQLVEESPAYLSGLLIRSEKRENQLEEGLVVRQDKSWKFRLFDLDVLDLTKILQVVSVVKRI